MPFAFFVSLVVSLFSGIAFGNTDELIHCSATSVQATPMGVRYAYRMTGFPKESTQPQAGLRFQTEPSLNIYQISLSKSVKEIPSGQIEIVDESERCENGACHLIQNFKLREATYGLTFQMDERLDETPKYFKTLTFTGKHQLTPTLAIDLQGQCHLQPFILNRNYHRNDAIVDANRQYVLMPGFPPNYVPVSQFSTRLNDVPNADGQRATRLVRGGVMGPASYIYRDQKVVIAVEHAYQALSSYSALYVYDLKTGAIANIAYPRNGRAIPVGTSDPLPSILDVRFDETSALTVTVSDAAGNRFEMLFSSALKYVSCRVLELNEGNPGLCQNDL